MNECKNCFLSFSLFSFLFFLLQERKDALKDNDQKWRAFFPLPPLNRFEGRQYFALALSCVSVVASSIPNPHPACCCCCAAGTCSAAFPPPHFCTQATAYVYREEARLPVCEAREGEFKCAWRKREGAIQ